MVVSGPYCGVNMHMFWGCHLHFRFGIIHQNKRWPLAAYCYSACTMGRHQWHKTNDSNDISCLTKSYFLAVLQSDLSCSNFNNHKSQRQSWNKYESTTFKFKQFLEGGRFVPFCKKSESLTYVISPQIVKFWLVNALSPRQRGWGWDAQNLKNCNVSLMIGTSLGE